MVYGSSKLVKSHSFFIYDFSSTDLGNSLEYLYMTDCDDIGIDRVLSLAAFQIYQSYATETPPIPTILSLIVGVAMNGTRVSYK